MSTIQSTENIDRKLKLEEKLQAFLCRPEAIGNDSIRNYHSIIEGCISLLRYFSL